MPWIDGHLDLAYLAGRGRNLRAAQCEPGGCITLPALRRSGVNIAFGTIFTELGVDPKEQIQGYLASSDLDAAERAGRVQLECYEALEEAGELSIVRSRDDLDRSTALPRIVILMEGADPIRSPEEVQKWVSRGVKLVGLTWALGSRYAGGNSRPGPLTPIGRDMVAALDAAGVVHDVSHLADESFDGVLSAARGRVVASHSNCRALLTENQRHLRDEQIRAIAARDGIVGLNLYTAFLALERRATVDDCVAHVNHVASVFGHRRGVALGSDMDGGFGIDKLPEGIEAPDRLGALIDALSRSGWSVGECEGFMHGNWERFLKDVL